MRKKEIVLFGGILIIAVIAWLLMNRQQASRDYGSIKITVAGEDFGTYSLNKDQKIDINGTNTVRIKDHEAQIIEASCPDHICIHMNPIDERGGMIVCLPNQVVIEGVPSAEAESSGEVLDGIAG